ncbi:acyl-ACP--UDP-N-acetylglucosamine O-acyltransferase [Planctomycetales bacterium ZRK34]|nr:acyl-ACP--UDP-N-acetylglucosamine O-acyltransferase [Planctomycetales bacterium ZRK34]
MPQIHPSAIVDRSVELADNVVVGPFCIIRGRVNIGAGTRLLHRVTIQGPVTIGEQNLLYPHTAVGYAPQDRKFDATEEGAGVVIGNQNTLREGVTIHRATHDEPTRLGDRNYMMVNTHLGHDVVVGNDCTFANGALMAGHVVVGDNVTFGGNAAVHQFCRVGRLVMMSGVVAVTQDVPPFCVVYDMRSVGSLNIVGLRRAGLREHVRPLKQAFQIFYNQKLPNNAAADRIDNELGDDPLCREFAEFIRNTKRGISPYRPAADLNPD